MRENALIIGFKNRDINSIELGVEEAVSNVIKHAFSVNEDARFSIICVHIPLGLKTIIKDKGLPFDPAAIPEYDSKSQSDASASGLGFHLMQQFMDDISFHILGRDGKEVHLVKYLHDQTAVNDTLPRETKNNAGETEEQLAPKSVPFKIRLARSDEAVEISKCAYDAYEYSYGHEHIYYPDRLKELIAGGQIISAIAISKDKPNEIMAHNAIMLEDQKDKIVEMGMAFTKKKYQNQGCSSRLGIFLLKTAVKKGITGILLDCTTAHIYSQKAAIKAGCLECCILLGIDPQAQSWKHFSSQSQRVSNVIAYKKVPLASIRKPVLKRKFVYAPQHHHLIIKKIYNNLKENPKITVPDNLRFEPIQKKSSILVNTGKSYQRNAAIEIISYGLDIKIQIVNTVNRLCLDKFEVIYLLLNLTDPHTGILTKDFESIGFFFAGIIPGGKKGDKLELQYLNNVRIDYDKILLYSDFSKQLLSYIKERDPVLNRLKN